MTKRMILAALLALSTVPALASDTSADRTAMASTTDEARSQAGHARGDATRHACDHCQARS
jgi:hypothetical protein